MGSKSKITFSIQRAWGPSDAWRNFAVRERANAGTSQPLEQNMKGERYTFEIWRAGKWRKVYSTYDLKSVRRDVADSTAAGVSARYTQSFASDPSSIFELLLHGACR
jgi:hypothetical protein